MNNLFGNWFDFTSKEERERKERIAFKKAYPLGEEEKAWEEEALKKLFADDKKADLKMMHFVAITLRQMKANAALDEDEDSFCSFEKAFIRFKPTMDNIGISDEQLKKIEALNEVILNAKTIEDLKI